MKPIVLDSLTSRNASSLRDQFAFDVLMGLSAEKKYLSSKYFYDSYGSELFEQITDLDEYYPTACEFEILQQVAPQIAATLGKDSFDIVELGAGDGRKTKVLLSRLQARDIDFSYIPVDISESAVNELCAALEVSHSGLAVQGIVGEYFDSIRYLNNNSERRKLVLFLGSNIGNFDFASALQFLRTIWQYLNHDDLLLVGFDLKKDIQTLLQAYNDSRGITRDFNLNVLTRINRELGGQFQLDTFSHYGLYNPVGGAMESYLVSLEEQTVYIDEIQKYFSFRAFEAIHMEYSYKYLLSDISDMAADTGFEVLHHWPDSNNYFVDALWQVRKEH